MAMSCSFISQLQRRGLRGAPPRAASAPTPRRSPRAPTASTPPPPAGPLRYSASTSLADALGLRARGAAHRPRAARTSYGSRLAAEPRAVHRVDADQLDARSSASSPSARAAAQHDLQRQLAALARAGPGVGDLALADPAVAVAERRPSASPGAAAAARRSTRTRSGPSSLQPHAARSRPPRRAAGSAPGPPSRRAAAPCRSARSTRPPRAGELGDDGRAVGSHLGEREADVVQVGHVEAARVGDVAAAHLRRALEQVADQRALAEPRPVVGAPAEVRASAARGTAPGRRRGR